MPHHHNSSHTMATLDPAPAQAAPTLAPKAPVKRSPMYASWHLQDKSTWNLPQRLVVRLGLLQQPADKPLPPMPKPTDKVPFLPVWRQWAWIMPRALAPLLIHAAFTYITGMTVHPIAAYCE